ncbi:MULTISPECIES: polyprenyl synthetase family protein [unclassified Lactobacillus]|uniref:polyprenyl synthetase family protein n=1 Tax=unclassified Lactobacillus TaxID=2620435 RepID=UPI00226984E2|nr:MULTISPECIES: polyprenyl synthetase family protein [unclassified Lactobacillus]MCX8721840.1 polyprenyl synthetase family protein [Lactobacillus sp. B4010]MCX8723624.1 polyprenyl synthetase family protein [Lactobacillus sp. B4005]MCX8731723.1 polyprenyl synthetase family protein [Lactobacillus sp. B4015]MCX8734003.1 polyprenyl synthetase family protein [Lactobacillus sp. B4012]
MTRLDKQLIQVQKIIHQNVALPKGKLGEALEYAFSMSGKQLRPSFVLLFGEMGNNQNEQKIYNIASSVEILHNATLIHDDIIDNSATRRGRESVQAKFGKTIALYSGDYLFALSLQLLSENTSRITDLRINGSTMQEILAGETMQYGNEYNITITEQEYLEQIRGKTASLFGYACYIGALEGGLSRSLARKAQKVGLLFGQAFQLRDDILDYTSTETELKKPVLMDVLNGVYTGPLIFALKKDETGELKDLVKIGKKLSLTQLRQIDKLVSDLGGINYAQNLANKFTVQALHILKKYFSGYTGFSEIVPLIQEMQMRKY